MDSENKNVQESIHQQNDREQHEERVMDEAEVDSFILGVVNPNWHKWWLYIPEIMALACIAGMSLLVMINAIGRYTNFYRIPWAPDIIYVCFYLSAFLGGALGVKYDAHVKVGILVDRLLGEGILSKIWKIFILISPIIMGSLLVVLGIFQVKLDALRLLEWTQVPTAYFTIFMPLSGLLMIYYSIRSIWSGRAKNKQQD